MRGNQGACFLVLALAIVALLGPCLAGDRPLIAISAEGIDMPALRAALSLVPWSGPERPPAMGDAGWSLGPPIAHDPLAIDLDSIHLPPGAAHWLGTDELGRDLLSRLLHAARPSLLVALVATAVSLLIGIPIGAASGYAGPRWDLILSRLMEASLSFPALVLLLLLTALTLDGAGEAAAPGSGRAFSSVIVVGVAVGLARWAVIARYTRGEVLRLARTDMATAARAAGASPLRVLGRHILPVGMAPVSVSAAFGAGTAVVAEASLSFLGLGVQPPAPTWGQMLASAASHGGHWWMLVFPGAMVALTVAAFNVVGENLRRRGRRVG